MSALSAYTFTIEEGVRVKHGAQARFTVKAGRKTLEDGLTSVSSIGGAITRASIVYNSASYRGGVAWWNPATGETFVKAPTVRVRLRPEDVLTGGQLCDCPDCSKN